MKQLLIKSRKQLRILTTVAVLGASSLSAAATTVQRTRTAIIAIFRRQSQQQSRHRTITWQQAQELMNRPGPSHKQ